MNITDRYQNKLFSILGDSMSTFGGYSEPGDAIFYDTARKYQAGLLSWEDTWWGQVIARLGGTLLVNNSISGSMVSKHRLCEVPTYGCSDERTSGLGRNGEDPDVIIILMGTNDWGGRIKPALEAGDDENNLAIFAVAYRGMIEKLRRNYPNAEIWCLTLPVSTCKKRPDFVFPHRFSDWHIEEYCREIRACARDCGCRLIDLYRSAEPYDTIDCFHPNADGMKTLSEAVLQELQRGLGGDH